MKFSVTRTLATMASVLSMGLMPGSSEAAYTVTVVNHNITGERTDNYPDWFGVRDQVLNGADVATMQEVCSADFAEFQAFFAQYGWHTAFIPMSKYSEADLDKCGVDGDLGLVLAANRPMTLHSYRLPVMGKYHGEWGYPGGKEFILFCADVPSMPTPGLFTFCTTHLWSGHSSVSDAQDFEIRAEQATRINSILKPLVQAGRRVILTGDFNSKPDSLAMDRIYRVNPDGSTNTNKVFWEVDNSYDPICGANKLCRDGRPTIQFANDNWAKYDYIFAGNVGVHGHTGLALTNIYYPGNPPTSTHKLIKGWVNFQ
ncbi:endonuclease/exonuclease/phosphatase family protein [Archangium gephyra]|uniref:endonuclease/exonuclease/phosphatase family protein n=1 Tax=Archangium gephyra TaxID=48 RepID=UPI003B803F22